MIVVKLMGGLGNQMFQYAIAKALSIKYKTDCKVDLSFLLMDPKGQYTPRKFELDVFEEEIAVIETKELDVFLNRINKPIKHLLSSYFPVLFPKQLIVEKGHGFQKEVLECSKNSYLSGFWQTEKYFKYFEKEIRKSFKFKNKYIENSGKYLNEITVSESVSIHIRRGDYVTNASANEFHGMCGIDYYQNAVELINEKIKEPNYFIFSDDIEWCKNNLKINKPFCYIETGSPYKDLYLMQSCKHNIIANSSFSWWGAWLNDNKNKIVIAPKTWFNDTKVYTNDIIPDNWIKI